jgi:hypothetical protein
LPFRGVASGIAAIGRWNHCLRCGEKTKANEGKCAEK